MKTYLTSPLWHTIDGVSVRGYVVVDGRMLCGDDMARYFAEAANVDILHRRLETSDGLFAVVVVRERLCAIAVDRVRSIPLFYSPDGIADTPYPLAPPPFVLDKASAMAYKASAATFRITACRSSGISDLSASKEGRNRLMNPKGWRRLRAVWI